MDMFYFSELLTRSVDKSMNSQVEYTFRHKNRTYIIWTCFTLSDLLTRSLDKSMKLTGRVHF